MLSKLKLSQLILLFFIIDIAKSSYCGSYIPRNQESCGAFTNSTSICCYLYGNYQGTHFKMCYPIDREFYYTMTRTVEINGYLMKLDCGSKRGASCGTISTPASYKDCSIYSVKKNSCCFYRFKGDTGCIWLGSSDIGMMKYKALTVICGQDYLKLSWKIIFGIFALVIFA